MPFLDEPFNHDVFVSYPHGHDSGHFKNWSQCLVSELKSDICNFHDEFDELDVFIDSELDPTLPLTEQLRDSVRTSGLLLVVMCRRYLRSAWCRDELEWFDSEVKRIQADGGAVLVVRAQPTEHDAWPTCLKDERGHVVLGFQFHPNAPGREDEVRPYGYPSPLAEDRAYYEAVSKLSTIVTRRLKHIRDTRQLHQAQQTPSASLKLRGQPTIYLRAPKSQADAWASTKRTLEDLGCRVLPSEIVEGGDTLLAIQQARRERLRLLREEAHAMCLLRPEHANGIDQEIEVVASDRSVLEAFDKHLPCVVLNRADDEPVLARHLQIDTIDATDSEWQGRFKGWLNNAVLTAAMPA